MPTYEVLIEETISGSFLLDAPTADEAAESGGALTGREGWCSSRASCLEPGSAWWGRTGRAAPGRMCERGVLAWMLRFKEYGQMMS
jgi:hypothetical protein